MVEQQFLQEKEKQEEASPTVVNLRSIGWQPRISLEAWIAKQ